MRYIAAGVALALTLIGCQSNRQAVVATTATVIGVEVATNGTNQPVNGTLGYKRAEFAFVPTDRMCGEADGSKTVDPQCHGAERVADVVMELRFKRIWGFSDTDDSGIYQRLAVGKNAVATPGAAIMFARGPDGKVDENIAAAILAANSTIATRTIDTEVVGACVLNGGNFDTGELAKLVDTASASEAAKVKNIDESIWEKIKGAKTRAELDSLLTIHEDLSALLRAACKSKGE